MVSSADRRTAGMLAACVLILAALFVAVDVTYSLAVPDYQVPWFGYVVLASIYGAARSSRFELGAVLLVAMFPLVGFVHIATGHSAYPAATLGFISLSPLLAAVFLPSRSVPWIGLANIAGIFSLRWLAPSQQLEAALLASAAVSSAIVTALALLHAYHRNQLEAERARALRASEARLRSTLEGSQLGFFDFNTRTGEVEISDRIARILGIKPEDWGGTPEDIMRFVHPEDRQLVASHTARARAGEASVAVEHRILAADGSLRWVEVRGQTVEDEPHRVLGTMADVTERRQLEERLRQTQKMEAIGQLAGGVAHDFNNLLTVVLGNVHLLGTRAPSRELEQIEQAATSARSLTSQLLAFSRRSSVEQHQPVDLDDTVASAKSMIRRIIGERIVVTYEPPECPCVTRADAALVQQALLNLAANARDAMPDGGNLSFRVHAAADSKEPAKEFVWVSVTDDGVGMPLSTKKRLFEPFFTTKAHGKGTGLGLTMVRTMMDQVGGDIEIESEPGRGTTIMLKFPRIKEPTPARPARSTRLTKGHDVILLVEDEAMVRELCQRVLTHAGYQVLVATNAEQARSHWLARRRDISLVVSDVVMPRTSGPELASELLSDRPDLRILFMSGYAADLALSVPEGSTRFIAKPFGAAKLLDEVSDLLAAAPRVEASHLAS